MADDPSTPNSARRIFGGRRRRIEQAAATAAVAQVVKAVPQGTAVNSEQLVALASRSVGATFQAAPEAVVDAMIEQGMGVADPFGPGTPLNPYEQDGTTPRGFDYPVGTNIVATPRTGRVSFDTIRSIIDAYDVAQVCIRHQVNDVRSLDLLFQPMDGVTDDVADDLVAARAFFRRPDGRNPFRAWLAMLLTDMLRYDAPAIFRRRDVSGRLIAAEVVSGRSIIPLVDYYGRRPTGDAPAYVQIVTGLPWVWLTEAELLYQPLNPLVDSQYGLAPMEAVLLTANTDLRFQWYFLQHFTEGTIPDGFAEAPPDQSSVNAVQEWQTFWDAVMEGDQSQKHKVKWVPAGTKYTPTKSEAFDDAFPLYLMRRVCAAFGVTPTDLGFTETVNKATSEVQADVQQRVGRQPIVSHLEDLFDTILQDDLGLRVQARFDTASDKDDQLTIAEARKAYVDMGALSPDEVRRDDLGLPVDPEAMMPRTMSTPAGPVPLAAIMASAGVVDVATLAPDPDLAPLVAPAAADVPVAPTGHTGVDDAVGDDLVDETPDAEDHVEKAAAMELARWLTRSTMTVTGNNTVDPTVAKNLSAWRRQSRARIADGRRPRLWTDVPEPVAKQVWSGLEAASTREEVDAAFAAVEVGKARPKAPAAPA